MTHRVERVRTIGLCTALAVAVACGDSGSVTDPLDEEAIEGLSISASVALAQGGGHQTIKLVSVQVVITNTTEAPVTHHYAAGCPVRMRLYDAAGGLVFDDSAHPCNVNQTASFTLQPGASTVLASTPHFPWDVSGDSITPGPFAAAGLLRLTGQNPVEVQAGNYMLPRCEVVGPPGGFQYMECT